MPMYEYQCAACAHQFEELALKVDAPAPTCPQCGKNEAQRLMSAGSVRPHGVPTGSGGYTPPPCGPGGGG